MRGMRYNLDTCAVELSVRALCEMATKRGDLGGARHANAKAMADGGAIHRKLQAEAKGFYCPEVSLSNTMLYGGIYFTVSGRADGTIRHGDSLEVDEIKCVRGHEFAMPPRESFLAQMKCYAYFLAVRDDLSEVHARLTYYDVDTKKTKYFHYRFQTDELRLFYVSLLQKIERWAKLLVQRMTDTLPKASQAFFPYSELREGQEIMIREVFSSIRRGKRLFVEAPTGTGKTVSALYPAVRALGEEYVQKIFYLTAKASTGREAYRAAGKLFETGVSLRTVMITAKEQMCLFPIKDISGMLGKHNVCNPKDCEFARGYYDRVEDALWELLQSGSGYPRQKILEVAQKYHVCPYELSLDLSEFCDVVICDYNYAFDPSVYFRRYFASDAPPSKYVFLIDEAHNLADRARDMYSATLCVSELEALRELLGEDDPLSTSVESMVMTLRRLRNLCAEDIVKDADGQERGFYMSRSPLTNLNGELEIFQKNADAWLKKNEEHLLFSQIDGVVSKIRRYLAIQEFFDEGFLCYVELSGGDVTVKTYCLNPSPTMDALLNRASSAILFSATLTPAEYFCDVLGGPKKAVSVSLPSPFDPENLCVTVADYISTRMDDREKNYARYASVIAATVSPKAGNYIAYFPSYACLEGVWKAFVRKYPKVETVVQRQGMGIAEKESFLRSFKEDRGHLRVGFCVLGGTFSEGVDLPGSRLIGCVIFGVGLPGLSNERNMIEEYFEQSVGQGYDYAYTYPGMNHVLQAVGRVIRRDGDRGVAVLVDDRYAAPKYRALFPAHWQGVQYAGDARSVAEIMRRFWKKND